MNKTSAFHACLPYLPAGKLPGSGKANSQEPGKFVCHARCKPHLRNTSLAWRPGLREPLEALREAGPPWLDAVFLLSTLSSASFNEASHKVNLHTISMKNGAPRPAKHGALRCIVQCICMYSQSISLRPRWALQTTSAKHRVLQWLLLARFTTHTILLQLRLLIPCLSSRVVASWLTLRIC